MKYLDFFRKDRWIGEGTIVVEDENETYPMVMKIIMKNVNEKSPILEFTTSIKMDSSEEAMENFYTLTMHRNNKFHTLIAGINWGHVEGSGFFKENFIGWDVVSPDGLFHGYESIELKKDGELIFFGEYATGSSMRTKIRGRLTSYENVPS